MKIVDGPNQTAGVYGAYIGAIIAILGVVLLSQGGFQGLTFLLLVFAAGIAAFLGALCANAGVLTKTPKLGALAGAAVMLLPFVVQGLMVLFGQFPSPSIVRMLTLACFAMLIGGASGAVGGWVERRLENHR